MKNKKLLTSVKVGGWIIAACLYFLFCVYAYENAFFEIFMGKIGSVFGIYERAFVGISFVTCCVLYPLWTWKKGTRTRFWAVLCISNGLPVLFMILVSITNLSLHLDLPIKVEPSLRSADAIVVIDKGSFPTRGRYGAELYHKSYAKNVVVFVHKIDRNIQFLRNLEIPDDAITWARKGQNNTFIEASTTSVLIEQNNWKNVLIVADDFHMYRTMLTLKKIGIQNAYPTPVPRQVLYTSPARLLGLEYRDFWDVPLADVPFNIKFRFRHVYAIRVFHEYAALCFYSLMGYI